jgi:5-methyltetrahydropteroyltriglutamate--homocysteine methyltransferase
MKRSTDRILTTHTGSLPRPPDLVDMMIRDRQSGHPVDASALAARVKAAVDEVVQKQVEAGVDVVSDGELGKPAFNTYVAGRLSGFGGENREPRPRAEAEDFPGWASQVAQSSTQSVMMRRGFCEGPLSYLNREPVEVDIRNLKSALVESPVVDAFIPSASLGTIHYTMANRYYPDDEAYLYALADAMREEYRAIANAGFILQVDAPDHAMDRHVSYRNNTVEEFRRAQTIRVDALNHALEGIPEEQIRYHVCWGNYEGPHTHDVPLHDIIDLILRVRAGAYSVEASNPRHAHEWQVWEEVTLPPGKILIPGVIDTTTNFVEHPEVVAQRIERYANLVGRENLIAGTDCGFGTSAGRDRVHPEVVWAKLRALSDGARLASARLWG